MYRWGATQSPNNIVLSSQIRRHATPRRDGGREGATRQAFQGGLRQELADFYRLLSALEGQNGCLEAAIGTSKPSYLTLRRLIVWLAIPLVSWEVRVCLLPACMHSGVKCKSWKSFCFSIPVIFPIEKQISRHPNAHGNLQCEWFGSPFNWLTEQRYCYGGLLLLKVNTLSAR